MTAHAYPSQQVGFTSDVSCGITFGDVEGGAEAAASADVGARTAINSAIKHAHHAGAQDFPFHSDLL